MAPRGTYHTRQKALLQACLLGHGDRYLTVRQIEALLLHDNKHVGSTTVYRNLEAMVVRGEVVKFVGAGGEARYCLAPERSCGQLVCLDCGRVQRLDCHMLGEFSDHVRSDHGFDLEMSKAVLYGHCGDCRTHVELAAP